MTTEPSQTTAAVFVENTDTGVVEVITQGPQGISADAYNLGDLQNVDTSAKTEGSVLYYDNAAAMWKGDDINTLLTITDGGNF